jgi:hypothetical protein
VNDNYDVLHLEASVCKICLKPGRSLPIPARPARYIGIRGGLYTIAPAISTLPAVNRGGSLRIPYFQVWPG